MSAWEIASLDELDAIPVEGAGITWRPIRRRFGIHAFGINAYTAAAAGEHVVEEHTEERLGHEEVYVVVRGHARFTLGDEEVDAPAGTIVYLRDPAVKRAAVAQEPGTTVLAVGGAPGAAFEPSAWEWFFAAAPHHAAGEYERGLEIVREGLEERPEHPALLYHVARFEALLGRRDDALAHLARAAEIDSAFATFASDDDDFAPIREDPRFPA